MNEGMDRRRRKKKQRSAHKRDTIIIIIFIPGLIIPVEKKARKG
jgi:hypothetical protein